MVVGTTQAPEMIHPSKVLNTYAKSMDWNDCPVVHKPEMGRIHMTKPTYLGSDTLHMGESIYYGKTGSPPVVEGRSTRSRRKTKEGPAQCRAFLEYV